MCEIYSAVHIKHGYLYVALTYNNILSLTTFVNRQLSHSKQLAYKEYKRILSSSRANKNDEFPEISLRPVFTPEGLENYKTLATHFTPYLLLIHHNRLRHFNNNKKSKRKKKDETQIKRTNKRP